MVILTNIFTFKSGLFMLYYVSMSNMLIYPVIMNGVNIQIVLEKKIFFIKIEMKSIFFYIKALYSIYISKVYNFLLWNLTSAFLIMSF